MKKILRKIYRNYSQNLIDFEYKKSTGNLIDYGDLSFSLLEIGSGLCHFLLFIKNRFPEIKINAIDISQDLVDYAMNLDFKCQQGYVINLPFSDNSFYVFHCSQVIE